MNDHTMHRMKIQSPPRRPPGLLALADGSMFEGELFGAIGPAAASGEVVFNTALSGYQEVLTDPSYAGQIITFTNPHIGNYGVNAADFEAARPFCRGVVVRELSRRPSNRRSEADLDALLVRYRIPGITGIDTRRLTRRIRDGGAPNGVVVHAPDGVFDIPALVEKAQAWPGLEGMDLAKEVSSDQLFRWSDGGWELGKGYKLDHADPDAPHVVAIDYGAKRNIFRNLVEAGARVTVLPVSARMDLLRSCCHTCDREISAVAASSMRLWMATAPLPEIQTPV